MRLRSKYGWIDPAYILWLIRENQVKTIEDLHNKLSHKFAKYEYYSYYATRHVYETLNNLQDAGLVEIEDEHLRITPLVLKVQTALDLSLRDLQELDPWSIAIKPFFGKPQIDKKGPNIFVLMPFSGDLKPIYEDHIKPVASQLGLTVARADDFFAAQAIVSDIWNAIYYSQIIIADCTGRNPNVFYEIGIAHTVGRSTILISQDAGDIPFDLRHIRHISYKYTPRGMAAFNEALCKTLEAEKTKIVSEVIYT